VVARGVDPGNGESLQFKLLSDFLSLLVVYRFEFGFVELWIGSNEVLFDEAVAGDGVGVGQSDLLLDKSGNLGDLFSAYVVCEWWKEHQGGTLNEADRTGEAEDQLDHRHCDGQEPKNPKWAGFFIDSCVSK